MRSKPTLLELFAGTGSVGKVFRRDFDVTSLELVGNPDIKVDIMAWDHRALPQNSFDVIWASPPCTMYSRARTTAKTPRDLEGSDAMVRQTLDILEYFKPKIWMMENPQTGMLKDREVVEGLPFRDVCYCMYGMPYKKPMRIWNNWDTSWIPRPMCSKQTACENVTEGRHPISAQRRAGKLGDVAFSQADLYAIPVELVEELHASVQQALQL